MKHRWRTRAGLVLASILALAMFLPACSGDTDPTTAPPTTTAADPDANIKNPESFIMATIGYPDSLDPAYGYDTASGESVQLVYDTLLTFKGASTTEFLPALATEWTISADGKTYRFHIRTGVKFHNGNDLTPSDVEYSFERGMVQDYGAGPQWMFFEPLLGGYSSRDIEPRIPLQQITDAVQVDGEWVQFNLIAPYAPFLQILAGPWGGIVDKEWCVQNGDWDGSEASYAALNDPDAGASPLQAIMNGTGPFKLERWDPGVEISFVRYDAYWQGPANFERVIIKTVDEWSTRKLMLQNGDVDYAYVPATNFAEMEGATGLTIIKNLPTVTVDSFFFQMSISPQSTMVGSGKLDGAGIPLDFFTDINVRKGFSHAFDFGTYLQDALSGQGVQAASPVINGLSYYNPNLTTKYNYDLVKAREYLQAAWGGQVWEKGFTLTLAYNSGNLPRKLACEILQAGLFAINPLFKVNIQVMQWPTLLRGMYTGLLPAFQIGWLPDFTDAHNFVVPFMHSQGTFSGWQNYNNPEADALIAEGISSIDPQVRQQIYDQLAQIYYDDAPGILLAQPLGQRYFKDWIQGFVYNPALPSQMCNIYLLSKTYK
ncbi:MAG: ABC transporter substrate-binding protein [Dehalogenimonas sp.]|uniref:ABC transporter substrate-binding protein n=1 Tax=Candidatus Dehalogenimonas loeffleri TaxID=3127115 RepID=A0ABZ2J8H1_9CHLR|nr:ABC transporter substrate-binding protein [Dehalogenimonas sp.]